MAIRVPSAAAIAEKWARVSPTRAQDYTTGVQGAAQAYQEGVNGAKASYEQGVQNAIANGSWDRGVQGKGGKYASKAAGIGSQRWGTGISGARSDYEQGVARPLQALAAVTLSPRAEKGNPMNLQRVSQVVAALRASKMS